ncbi:hypothetical protein LMG29542_02283 [Paraburkholderia humisilvae]|uniref:Uncharacterized protein n=1 Tax=Paraburkholderia humisilvae TaxID=627669 RepID=A0A6J5DMJ2_9BURK|nr:hypothetical protein LMG29542_02283 [Paraburkholderia humisilvae]
MAINCFAPVQMEPQEHEPRWVARFDAICTENQRGRR